VLGWVWRAVLAGCAGRCVHRSFALHPRRLTLVLRACAQDQTPSLTSLARAPQPEIMLSRVAVRAVRVSSVQARCLSTAVEVDWYVLRMRCVCSPCVLVCLYVWTLVCLLVCLRHVSSYPHGIPSSPCRAGVVHAVVLVDTRMLT